ncbi:hypothetical protein RRG08_045089 [Elysia crispata]|uniref:Uncharacterized protein n=1 Tax=Elysia crispata TaxID=231223 RepID=A0AAE0YSM8_9GAST|nr:hypothetical protein RRG08_045089 [Elysia crispata]
MADQHQNDVTKLRRNGGIRSQVCKETANNYSPKGLVYIPVGHVTGARLQSDAVYSQPADSPGNQSRREAVHIIYLVVCSSPGVTSHAQSSWTVSNKVTAQATGSNPIIVYSKTRDIPVGPP